MPPLNRHLYNALQRRFRRISISSEGERYVPGPIVGIYANGRQQRSLFCAGEYYRVNCPFCRDSRQRLYINHMFGVVDPVTGDDHLHLAHCFNEACIGDRPMQRRVYEMIYPFGYGRRQTQAQITSSSTSVLSVAATRIVLPQNLVPLTDLAASSACRYLLSRGFDPEYLIATYDVSFCPQSATPPPAITDRIVIPVYSSPAVFSGGLPGADWRLAGWQARAVHEPLGREPKYLSARGMKKSQLLYGLRQSLATTGPVVIVEGPTDVWRLGPGAVALFGKDASAAQQEKLICSFRRRPLVILLDRDAQLEANLLHQKLSQARRDQNDIAPVILGTLPVGRNDVGECSHVEARAAVNSAIESHAGCFISGI
jgi:hypothetical protein